ncbi:hypothetical protein [Novosphingobium sp. AAP93]|uniref:hypothetical protein n=1 Tax=Novosphingobium sp. AAP93 TaxID=1523427 RepID=UPI0006CD1270|nr:hypothetical protein [Novosphingobium sp. AAP93]KPF82140.1 hypothetical protein IP83_11835 [Novosphingobium sp. AAP93]
MTSTLDYIADKVDGKEPAGAPRGSAAASATAKLEVRSPAGGWVTKWTKSLVNEVAPVYVVVAPEGKAFATFDNWYSVGFGPSAIVVYNGSGVATKAFALDSIFPDWFVSALSRSVSSIQWRGQPRLSGDGTEVLVPIDLPELERTPGQSGPQLELRIRLADAAIVGLDDAAWRDALRNAAKVAHEQCIAKLAETEAWNAPISAPVKWDEVAWHHYLNEIGFRTVPGAIGDDGPVIGTTVLRPGNASDFRASLKWLQEAVTERSFSPGYDIRVIGSPDMQSLGARIVEIAARIKPKRLTGVRFIIVADPATGPAIETALSRTGATVTIMDPNRQIPQIPGRMDKTTESERPICRAPTG